MNRITDSLWIGDILDAERGDTSMFDVVVTICQDSVADNVGCTYHQYPLSDGPPEENSKNPGVFEYDLFENAVDTIVEHLRRGDKVFVHCHAGKSRSVTACAAALATIDDISFENAIDRVRDSRRIDPTPETRTLGVRYTSQAESMTETKSGRELEPARGSKGPRILRSIYEKLGFGGE